MPIELRSASGLGIVAVPDAHVLQPDGLVELRKGVAQTVFADDVVSRDVRVAGIDAGGDGNVVRRWWMQLGHLLEAAAQRVLRAGGVLDQDRQTTLREIETLQVAAAIAAAVCSKPASRSLRETIPDAAPDTPRKAPAPARLLRERLRSTS